MCTGEASYYRDYKRLELFTKLATSYVQSDAAIAIGGARKEGAGKFAFQVVGRIPLQRHLFISLLISIRCAICTSSVLTAFASPILLISMSCKALYFKYLHTMKEKSNTCANITSQYWLKMR